MKQAFRSIIPGIVSGLINAAIILPIISIFLGFYLSVSLEAKLAIFNIGLILFAIILTLKFHFTNESVRIIKTQTSHHTYLVKKNIARHIPDGETFEYLGEMYGFHWGKIEVISHDEFTRQFSTDSTLPSIIPHCQAFCEKHKKQKEKV